MGLESLIKKYESDLCALYVLDSDYDSMKNRSGEDYYSAGETSGKIKNLKQVIKDLKEINRGD